MANSRIALSQMSLNEIDRLRMLRWKARTDLGFLCREILSYPDVHDPVHTPILNILQQFPIPNRLQFEEHDQLIKGNWIYKPIQRHTSLPGGRRVLLLDPRGWLKTTINAQAHTIQWILNYPDIAIMIVQSNLEKAEMILSEIKKHFQYNPFFRDLFPEHCPTKGIDEFGTKDKFTTKARSRTNTRKEHTVMASSIDAGSSGIHMDVIKFSDIVEPSNTGTPEQMDSVATGFYMAENLLVGPNYWIDVEGTRYDFGDLYGRIIKTEKETPVEKRVWKIHARGCYKKKTPNGVAETFVPEELEWPDMVDEEGHFIPHWIDAERGFTYEHFESKRRSDSYIFSSQQLNFPQGGIGGRSIFPLIENAYPAMIKRKNFTENVRISHYIATVDTAETANDRSNYSAITVAGFASDGRVYVNEIIHGKFLPNEIVQHIIDLPKLTRKGFIYGPKLKAINIEETGFVRGFRVALDQYMQTTGNFLPLEMIKRDNRLSKIERIQNTLQPYYMDKRLIFLDDITCLQQLYDELRQFPKSSTDDILDTLADIFQNKAWFGREIPKLNPVQYRSQALQKWLGIDNPLDPDRYILGETSNQVPGYDSFYNKTGGL